jgi:hypothetical protein
MRDRRTRVVTLLLFGLGLHAVEPAHAQIRGRDAAILGIGAAILGGTLLNQQLKAQPRDAGDARQRQQPQPQPKRSPASEASSTQTLAIQQALVDQGFDVPIDGQLGPSTRIAISAYQRANRLPVTGRLTPQQAQALLAAPVAGLAAGQAIPAFADQPPGGADSLTLPAAGPTTVSTTGPRALPVSPDAPEWASGTWSGTFSCRRRTYTVTMTVPVEGRGEQVVLDYRWTANAPAAGTGQGRVLMDVSTGTSKRFNAVRVDAGEPNHPFGQLRVLADQQQSPTFSSGPCRGMLALSRDPRTAPDRSGSAVVVAPSGPAAPAAPSGVAGQPGRAAPSLRESADPSFFGRWQGELSCAKGVTRPIEVTFGRAVDIAGPPTQRDRHDQVLLSADRPGRVAAEVASFAMRGSGGTAVSTRFIGETETDGRTIRFASVSSSAQLGDLRFRELRIDTQGRDRAALNLDLSVADMNCSAVALRRPDPLGVPERPAVRIPANGGTFYRAQDDGSRCNALAEWGRRIETDFKTEVTQYRPVDPGVLFADPEFVPVFGRPYDLTGDTTFFKDISTALRNCQRDPLMRPRLQGLDRLVWSLRDGLYVSHRVRQSRAALNTLAAAQAGLASAADPATAIIQSAKAKEEFRKADIALFPSRRDEIVARVEEGLSTKAAQIFDREIDQQRGKPPADVIAYVRDARPLSSPVTENIKGPARDRAASRLLDIEAQAAAAFMTANLASLAATPATLAGLRQIDALPVAATLPALSPTVRSEHEKRWTADRTAKMDETVGHELAGALTLPNGRTGLEQGAAWYAAFARAWQGYLGEPPVKAALGRFFEDRKSRLLAATEEYRAAVAGRNPAERREALAGFLLLPQDRKSPVALEYDMIAFGL